MGYQSIQFMNGSVFLVTGGAGFIGSNLCEALLRLGYKVHCLDNLSTGHWHNMAPFFDHPNYTFIKGDVREMGDCLKACDGVDYVLHEAAFGSVPRSIEMPVQYCMNNIVGTVNMMEAARQQGVQRFIYASSSSVYGDDPSLPKREGVEGAIQAPYALTKMCCEEWGKQYYMQYGLEAIGLRYFNVFGRRQDPNGAYAAVIPRFIKLLLLNKTPTIYGDGIQSRDFTYIENVIEANLKACIAPKEAAGQCYNIAYGERIRLIDIFNILSKLLGKEIQPVFEPERKGDIKHSDADISKARKILGYSPEWSFHRGIEEVVVWYQNVLTNS
ncbi:SDR family oxidoreductase [Eubacteriales bacterium OttesenSCG-928-A19]|nr:SDR family oxidoreductase [Eubacteriales bacterium OttesenSCG-928-A19]